MKPDPHMLGDVQPGRKADGNSPVCVPGVKNPSEAENKGVASHKEQQKESEKGIRTL